MLDVIWVNHGEVCAETNIASIPTCEHASVRVVTNRDPRSFTDIALAMKCFYAMAIKFVTYFVEDIIRVAIEELQETWNGEDRVTFRVIL